MDRLDALKSIAAQAGRGELSFPTHVNATLKLQHALSDPDCHVEEAARLVQAEPLLAARTVAIANSAAYNRAGNDVTNVRAAVQRVGFRTLGALAASVIVRQLASGVSDPAAARQGRPAVAALGQRGRAGAGDRAARLLRRSGNGDVRRHRARGRRLLPAVARGRVPGPAGRRRRRMDRARPGRRSAAASCASWACRAR